MKHLGWCLIWAVSGWQLAGAAQGAPRRPVVVAHYYTWYGLPGRAHGSFGHWKTSTPSALYPQGNDPSVLLFPPAIRQINSGAYPLIGPYDSMDREVVRWHMRLAKAAGIDAFSVDWWGPATWQQPRGWTHDVFVKTVLPVAEEEGLKLFLFDETAQFVKDFASVRQWTIDALRRFSGSKAWLRLDGKPVWAIYQLWEGQLSAAQGKELIQAAEREVGPVYWIVDRMRARAGRVSAGIELFTPEEWLRVEEVDCFMGYAMFSTWRLERYDQVMPLYREWARNLHAAGKKVMVPVHPGHDNGKIAVDPWVMPRRNGETLREFWRAGLDAGADLIGITSFNEWPETTAIEPALTWPDPYQYLKIVARFQGRAFVPPALPDPAYLDPAMGEFLRERAAAQRGTGRR
ncbi:MAG: hypothetical protein QHJ73_05730 [Armatimonadota bacterium]|nr:hypothetical protein [Armatimonadota bacterium]